MRADPVRTAGAGLQGGWRDGAAPDDRAPRALQRLAGCCYGTFRVAGGDVAVKAAGWCWSWWTKVTWQKGVSCRRDTQGASVVTHAAQQLASRTFHSPATSLFSMNSEKTAAAPVVSSEPGRPWARQPHELSTETHRKWKYSALSAGGRALLGSRGHVTVSRVLALVTPVLPTCAYLTVGVVFMNDVRQISVPEQSAPLTFSVFPPCCIPS